MAFDATRADALNAVTAIYAEYGHALDAGDISDMDNRIRNGQTLAELVANTYDQAYKRFKVADTPTTRAAEAAGQAPSYDAQLNTGIAFDTPTVMMEQLTLPAREQAQQMNSSPSVSMLRAPSGNGLRYNAGPAPSAFGGGGMLGGLSFGTILMVGGGVILAIVLFKHLGKHK